MEQRAIEICAKCFYTALSDDAWQSYGFKGRPKSGSLFQRFRPRWKVELEHRILRELVITMFSAYVQNNSITMEEVRISISQYFSKRQVPQSFGYNSQQEGIGDFEEQIRHYSETPAREWGKLMYNRIRPQDIPDRKLAARIMYGCLQVGNLPSAVEFLDRDRTSPLENEHRVGSDGTAPMSVDDNEDDLMKEALALLARHQVNAASHGCNSDEIPEGYGEYGLEVTNPIPVQGIPEANLYLQKLRWQGQPVTWDRLGSFGAKNIKMPVDCYQLSDQNSRTVGTIYISPYHRKMSNKAPVGFTLSSK